jgi:hypothetical protein
VAHWGCGGSIGVVVTQWGCGGSVGVVVAQSGLWWLTGVVVAQLAKARLGEPDCNAAVPGSIPASSSLLRGVRNL